MRFNNIQLLRVVAATSVVVYHLCVHAPHNVGVETGWYHRLFAGMPVPLFFAVSGFILAHVLQTCPLRQYLVARILRLYPGYWLALALVAFLMRRRWFTECDRWLMTQIDLTAVALWPAGPGKCPYVLGVEWSLIYEVFLSAAVAVLSLFGLRRGLPLAAGVWTAAIVAKVVLVPGYGSAALPHWSTIGLSAYNYPFLLGVLTYYIRDRGRRWRWLVAAAVGGVLYGYPTIPMVVASMEWTWCVCGVAAAGILWLAVNMPQLPDRNALVRAGDWTYGLYLVHTPLMLLVMHRATRLGWTGRIEVVYFAAAVALVGGLLFGWVEYRLHGRLRHLAKVRPAEVPARVGRFLRAHLSRPFPLVRR